jgi:glycosyltransferase involved in cell wall biosynthesis
LKTKFDNRGRGDYRFIKSMSRYRKTKFIDKTIVMVDQVNRGNAVTPSSSLNIEFVVPYAFDKNLGRAYNEIFEKTTADYVCLMDGDIMFFHNDFGHFISEAISHNPGGGIYTCLTNRIGNPEQRFQGRVSPNANMLMHKKTAYNLRRKYGYKAVIAKQRTSMLLSVIPKKVWEEFRFMDGLMNVDWDFSSRVMQKYPIYILQGLYVFHLYRLGEGGVGYTKHLQ